MKPLELIKILIEEVEEFSSQTGDVNLETFTHWLSMKGKEKLFYRELPSSPDIADSAQLVHSLTRWYRFFRQYGRKALIGSEISSLEDQEYLHYLAQVRDIRKAELISKHNMSMPSGIEIIRRLLKKGLIEEFDDLDDKRSHKIRITQRGVAVLEELMAENMKLIQLIVQPLEPEEIKTLLVHLEAVLDFHQRLADKAQKLNLDELLALTKYSFETKDVPESRRKNI